MSKRKKTSTKEQKTYQHSIPKRGKVLDFLREAGRPLKVDALLDGFDLKGQTARSQLVDKLKKMVRAGQIIENRRGEFCLIERLNLVTGKVSGHRDGFGFVARDDGEDDVYLSAREMRALFHGDRVAIKVTGEDRRGRAEGKLVDVLERDVQQIAGQFIRERGIGVVIPDNPKLSHRVLIAKGAAGEAKHGQIVVARILDYPTHVEQATGEIIEVIGHPDDKGIATDIAIQSHSIPTDWPRDVSEQAAAFGTEVPNGALKDRVDLRNTNLLTIDGADARDFDDAISLRRLENGHWQLGVHIADVSHFVKEKSALDNEAKDRATSVYLPDRVIPMLPEELSNHLCSLVPGKDRLVQTVILDFTKTGKLRKVRFADGVIRSAARLTYTQVAAVLEGQTRVRGVPARVEPVSYRCHAPILKTPSF